MATARPQLVQAVVAPGSEFIGRSIRELDFSRQFKAVIVGLWRRHGDLGDRVSEARLRDGDLLVLYGRPSHFGDLAAHHGFLMLVPFAGQAKRRLRAPLALIILGLTVLAAATEWLPASLAFLFGAVAMVVTRCVDVDQAYRGVDVRIFVMIAGVIPLGIAMEQTGTARLLANGLLHVVAHWPALSVLLVMFSAGGAAHPDPVGRGDHRAAGSDRGVAGAFARAAADAVRRLHRTGRRGRLPDADRPPRQPADPRARAIPVRRISCGWGCR